jgi:hypothetical protein
MPEHSSENVQHAHVDDDFGGRGTQVNEFLVKRARGNKTRVTRAVI